MIVILKILVGGYVLMTALLYLFQDKFIFFPQKKIGFHHDAFTRYETVIEREGIKLHGWFLNREISREKPLIVYFGGNAEEVSGNLTLIDYFETDSFLFMNYRGYGESEGKPAEKHLSADALFILDYLINEKNIEVSDIVLMGRSLGSGVATYVASKRKVRGLILVTPFDSLPNVARKHYPIFPVGTLLKHKFNSVDLAPDIRAPALFLIGNRDNIIPNQSSKNLYQQWGGPKTFVTVNGADHNTIEQFQQYWEAVNRFLKSLDS
ncbi:MAG: alpha/beta hydrolase [Deltaproteobacteria bacterium]|nr:alpha/beta hydrolase [Deltaproteobacteria bacterium]MBT4638078.1 alpha/beta hydrolase [Deltaproteobacteria bacterium]MBT6503421.1 alpha/beta hydrolase [Deltaproteobacteria bacterium]MBT6611413.1 alpha/beta hydrolase [Deltaproteobacteria bacterium]MBT7155133.1 alpha/beta hydrolase [Deltaproteobacteria bacterium]